MEKRNDAEHLRKLYPGITDEGIKSQQEYLRKNPRLKCGSCHRWMMTSKTTEATPLLRAEKPKGGICVECAGES